MTVAYVLHPIDGPTDLTRCCSMGNGCPRILLYLDHAQAERCARNWRGREVREVAIDLVEGPHPVHVKPTDHRGGGFSRLRGAR